MTKQHIPEQADNGQGLRIVQRAERQFSIESTNADPDNWEATYVHMQGFFGAHGPHVFAAAPEMLEVLLFLRDNYDVADVVDPIITKATGE